MDRDTLTLGGYPHRYYRALPDAPAAAPVVALHGFGTTGYRTYRHLAPRLRHAGVPLYAPDLLGFGHSAKPPAGYSLEGYAARTVDFTAQLGLGRPVLVGHSMGGKIAAATAALYPERFAGLILINSGGFSRYARLLPPLAGAGWVSRLFRSDWFFHHVLPRTPLGAVFPTEASRQAFLRLRTAHHDLDLDATGLRPRLRTLTLPVLVIWGERDPLLPSHAARRQLRDLPGARLLRLPEAGHAPMKDQPERVAEAVARFARACL